MRFVVLIPIYKVNFYKLKKIVSFLNTKVYKIICIDDCCPNLSGIAIKKCRYSRVKVIFNKNNLGVGGAMKQGFEYLKKIKYDYAVKIDGDGQINPVEGLKICNFAHKNDLEYVIGTRFGKKNLNFKEMPKLRWYGNKLISQISKITTGQYQLDDFLNGLVCLSSKTLKKIDLKKIRNNFFFETSMIFELSKINTKIYTFPMRVKYFKESSNFKPLNEAFKFFYLNLLIFLQRLTRKYFINTISITSFIILINILSIFNLISNVIFDVGYEIIIKNLITCVILFFLFIFLDYIENASTLKILNKKF